MVVIVDGAELFYETRGTGFPCIVPSILGTTIFEQLLPPPLTDVLRSSAWTCEVEGDRPAIRLR